MILTDKINDYTSLDVCIGPPTLKEGEIQLMKAARRVIILAFKPIMILKKT